MDPVALPLVRKMRSILGHLIGIGAGYLNLNRAVATLSGGESQRVKMARQLDCNLVGLMYVLDEPSVGLHSKDTQKLLDLLYHLRDQGNTILVVEHDPEVIQATDHVVEIGPRAGKGGGEVIFTGSVSELWNSDCATGTMLRKTQKQNRLEQERRKPQGFFEIRNACTNNLHHLDINIPKGVLCCITGVAGSGKSSLVHGELVKKYPAVVVDQQGVSRNSRSNALTYTGIFDGVRKEFACATGALASLFSFNSKGACPECKGQGFIKLEMSFLDDVVMQCSSCEGQRYKPEVLNLRWKGKSINDVLNMTVIEGMEYFSEKKYDVNCIC